MAWWRSTLFAVRGYQSFTKSGYERESRKWQAAQDSGDAAADKARWYGCTERDPHSLRVLITGANAGLGRAAAEELAALGATVIMVCRDVGRGQRAVDEIVASTGCARERIQLEIADVSLMGQVRELATRLLSEPAPLHCLVNNAGVLLNEPTTTTEGFDATLMTNLVSGYALTELLLPLLRLAAEAPADEASTSTRREPARARVINVSSGGMYTQHLDVSDMEFTKMRSKPGKWDGVAAYAQTKRQQVSLTEIMAEQYRNDGVAIYSCHPGWADTPGVQNSIPGFHERMHDSLRTPLQGADTIIWLAVSDQVDMTSTGDFFEDRRPVQKHLSLSGTASSCTPARYTALQAACRRYSGLDQAPAATAAASSSSPSPAPQQLSHSSRSSSSSSQE